MYKNDIKKFKLIKQTAREDLSYIISSNIYDVKNKDDFDMLLKNIDKLKHAIPQIEVIYALDSNGIQITNNISIHDYLNDINIGIDKSNRSYFYDTKNENRCQVSNPYLYLDNKNLAVTVSYPIYSKDKKLLSIICMEISLKNIFKMISPNTIESIFTYSSKIIYAIFSLALFFVAALLFVKGINSFVTNGLNFHNININDIFKSTILLTLALAIMDLLKAIFEEEVLSKKNNNKHKNTHITMVKFLGSIIIALSIEALMLVFKFALNDTSQILYAVYLILGVSVLIISLSYYLKVSHMSSSKKDNISKYLK